MKNPIRRILAGTLLALAAFAPLHAAPAPAAPLLIEAARVFDGERFHTDAAPTPSLRLRLVRGVFGL